MATTDARPYPKYATAYRHYFWLYDGDGDPQASAADLTAQVSIDGAAWTTAAGAPVEIGEGLYYLELSTSETTCDSVSILVETSSTGVKSETATLYPTQDGDIEVDLLTTALDFVLDSANALTVKQVLALMAAESLGKVSGMSTNSPAFKAPNSTTTRISATTTSDGRTAVTLTPPS